MSKKEKVKEITVCEECSNPLVSTFFRMGCEYYCPSCGQSGDMFMGKQIKATKKLIELEKKITKKFKSYVKSCYTGGGMLSNCDKCQNGGSNGQGEYHAYHLSEEENNKQKWALKKIGEMRLKKYRKQEE